MEKAKFVTKSGVECPNCGYLNQRQKAHYHECDNCKMPYEEPDNKKEVEIYDPHDFIMKSVGISR
jgi:hypothetical protein